MLELLVALAIMVCAFTIIWSTFSATIKAWTRGSAMLEDLHHGDFVMEQLTSALRSAAFFSASPGKYGLHLKDRGSGSTSEDRLSWVTSGTAFLPPDSPLGSGLHRIMISLEDGPGGKTAVAIRAWPHLAEVDEDSIELEPWYVSSEVIGLDCQVYDKEDEDWSDDWEDTNALPRLVWITLYMEPIEKYGEPLEIQRLIEIPVAPPLEAKANAPGTGGESGGEPAPARGGGASQEKPAIQAGEGGKVKIAK